MAGATHICSFQGGPDVTRKTAYEEFRAAVLKSGSCSSFEIEANQHTMRLWWRLGTDPSVKITAVGYPWYSVQLRNPEGK